ncbi:hypothetical protein, partial [Rhodopirellula bahusiensis]
MIEKLPVVFVMVLSVSCGSTLSASDHADPITLRHNEAGLTDLFAFESPDGESLVLVLCAARALTDEAALPLTPISYRLWIDCNSQVHFDDPDVNARYGGKVVRPEQIEHEVCLTFRLQNDGTLADRTVAGLGAEEHLPEAYTGLRDDPFIFHRFSNTNVVAIVQEIPYRLLPNGKLDTAEGTYLIWATSHRLGNQVDHVGRSLRTMLPRFDFLNTIEPKEHVAEIRRRHERPDVVTDVLSTFASPFFGIRHYDFEPDVMIFSRIRPAGYPNGRRLSDDVAKLCCDQGDCLLYEVSLAESHADHVPRPVTNNVPFLEQFPYLASVNQSARSLPDPALRLRTKVILGLIGVAAAAFLLLPWWLLHRAKRRLRRLSKRLSLPLPLEQSD